MTTLDETCLDIVADGLVFPEGPVVMDDGSVIVVELRAGRVTRCWDGRKETVCEPGGGPNGAAIGPDGALWLCNSGGIGTSGPGSEGRIERIDLGTGKIERAYESCEGIPLEAPNDLVFDASGRLWFTDLGTIYISGDRVTGKAFGGFYSASADGSEIVAIERGTLSYNGVGISPDGNDIYVADTFQARLYRYEACLKPQKAQYVATAPGPVSFDSLAVTAAGNICVATLQEGSITTFSPAGEITKLVIPGETSVTNIAFGGDDMRDAYITLSNTGRLARVRWSEPGLRLAFSA